MRSLIGDRYVWLVTGAAGFIGSSLVEALLRSGQDVIGLDNFSTGYKKNLDDVLNRVGAEQYKNFNFIEGSIVDPKICSFALAGVDFVLHQAALGSVPRSIAEPMLTNQANVDGFLTILDQARVAGVKKFVYASSSAIYGDSPVLPKVEEQIGNCLSPYAVSKRVNELYAAVFNSCYGIESVGLRYFNVFGPRQDPNGAYAAVIPKWIDAVMSGQQGICNGDGSTSRDFCFVDNVVEANIRAALCKVKAGIYNIACNQQTTLLQLWDTIVAEAKAINPILNVPPLKHQDFRQGDVLHSLADVSAAKRDLDFEAKISVGEGLRKTVEWYLRT